MVSLTVVPNLFSSSAQHHRIQTSQAVAFRMHAIDDLAKLGVVDDGDEHVASGSFLYTFSDRSLELQEVLLN
jgi:tRNA C32,U32 (ribose-2'-O)-methylase TrmJ